MGAKHRESERERKTGRAKVTISGAGRLVRKWANRQKADGAGTQVGKRENWQSAN